MSLDWGARLSSFLRSGKNLQIAWIITAVVVGFYAGFIRPREQEFGINNSRGVALQAAQRPEPLGLWRQKRVAGIVAGIPDSDKAFMRSAAYIAGPQSSSASGDVGADRKMVRTATLEMVVESPADTADKIRGLAEREGGFLVSSEVRGQEYPAGATLTIRVPAERYEGVRDQIRKLGLRVESERIEAQDVTRQYTDQEANLRNLRAEEQQYLSILKEARTVKDTLEVSEKLGQVRGQIEQQQAEFNALSKQTETVAITIDLRAEAEARVFGLNWRPLYQIKMALRDGLEGLANYFSAMAAFAFFLPTILLWAATIALCGAVGWRILRWVARRWFGWGVVPQNAATPAS